MKKLIQPLFSPSIALMNHLGYTKRFMLLGLLSLIAISVVTYSLFISLNQVIRTSQQELKGFILIAPISRTVQLMQKHRGLSAGYIRGNKTIYSESELVEKRNGIEALLKILDGKLPVSLKSGKDWKNIQAGWEHLRKEGLNLTATDNFVEHTRLIGQMLIFEAAVADEFWLTLDAEIDTYYLIDTAINKLPDALEQLGQIRAYGTGVLASRQSTEHQKMEMHSLITGLESALNLLRINLDKTSRYNPAMQNSLSATSISITDSAQHIADLVESGPLTGRFIMSADDFFITATKVIDMGYEQMYQSLLPPTETLIKERIAKAENALYASIGIAFLSLLVVAYFSIGIYFSTIRSIQSLGRSARKFASGDMRERAHLDTHDELRQVCDSFNEMANGLSNLLELNQKTIDSSLVGILAYHADNGRCVLANKAAAKIIGATAEQLLQQNFRQIASWRDCGLLQTAEEVLSRATELQTDAHLFSTFGKEAWLNTLMTPFVSSGEQHLLVMLEDITERKHAEEALRLQSEITANASEGISLVKAGDGAIHYANRQFEILFGYDPGELTGKPVSIINAAAEKPPQETADGIMRSLEKHGAWHGEILSRKKDGTTIWTSANVSTFQHPELGTLLITYQTDISEKKKTEEMIWKQANFDVLTGLPNRHMFRNRLEEEHRKANRAGQKLALMFIDLDRFKEVNDTLGHDMGDALLLEAARRIGDCVRSTDMVARMGGDEFTVILPEIEEISSVERVAQSILQKLAAPFQLKTDIVHVSASIGISLYPEDAKEIEDMLKSADQAMYVAKEKGRNQHSYFTHSMQEAARARLKLINDLRGALAANQFKVYFQPIVNLATGHIHKAEALIRWQHPERGLVSPADFIQLAEETGLIFEIGDWVFQESARWVKRWRELHHAKFQVSVNKSPVQFYKDGEDHTAWLKHLLSLGLPGQSLVIEITEGLLLDSNTLITGALLTFRDSGIQVAIDDFGTGYSSLSYLKKFDIDYLKIDQSFTRNLAPGSSDMALSEAIIMMAHKLGLKVIAEGVETGAQRDLLLEAGCDYAQGYLYSKPVPPEEFEKLLARG